MNKKINPCSVAEKLRMFSGFSLIQNAAEIIDELAFSNARLESALRPWPGGPTWRELVEGAILAARDIDELNPIDWIRSELNLSQKQAIQLYESLRRDPASGEKVDQEGGV